MSLLYTISKQELQLFSICVPFSLLVFQTLKRGEVGAPPSYGKWLVLFVITFLFNGLTILNSWIIAFVDLALKIGIYFLPDNMNDIIEDRIRNLHLEGIIQSYRCQLVNKLFDGFNASTHFLLKLLREEESQQFQDALIQSLRNKQAATKLVIEPKEKVVKNTEVQCIMITDKSIEDAKALFDKKLKLIEKEKQQIERIKINLEKKPISKNKIEAEREFEPKPQKMVNNRVVISKQMTQTLPAGGFKQRKPENIEKELDRSSSIKNLAQSQFSADDFEAEEEEKPVSKLKYSRNTGEKPAQKPVKAKKQETVLRRSNTTLDGLKINSSNVASRERSYSPDGSSIREQAQILEKLDLSVSEYSDMFDEEEEEESEEAKKLVCKVEAIVEIGVAPNARLEIYNLELYSNRDLRIVSLYGREFEKHSLVSMTKAPNSYYELHLSGSVVNKRRVKFRGQFQPFNKYLQ